MLDAMKDAMKTRYLAACLLIAPALLAIDPSVTVNWPQWRGPHSAGIAPDKNLPTTWSKTQNVVWKTPIAGRGYSSPIIWGNRIFLTTAIEGALVPGRDKGKAHKLEPDKEPFAHPDAVGYDHRQTLKVLALDAPTGKILWDKTVYEGPVFDSVLRYGSYASPTPVTDGKYVYSFFGVEGVYAHDFDGKQIWKANLGEWGTLGVGYGASPLLYGKVLILLCDDDDGSNSFIVGLDKNTGKELWRTKRPTSITWSSPVLAAEGGRAEVLTAGNEFVISYDPATGKELWRIKGLDANAVSTPLVAGDLAFFATGYPSKKTMAIRLGGSGNLDGSSNLLWTYQKGTAYTASNIVYGDYIYLITDKGILSCLDMKTGEVKYDNGRPPSPARYTASPVAFDGKVFITSEDGDTHVIQAGPEFKILGTNSLDEQIMASPAIAGGNLYIRGTANLYKIAAPPAASKR
jgi:outer membrane protein assembly factor BamB